MLGYNIVSLNSRGLADKLKRKEILTWLDQKSYYFKKPILYLTQKVTGRPNGQATSSCPMEQVIPEEPAS